MTDYITIQQIINEAIRTKTTVHIRYRDYHGNISSREISPLEWVESGKILALCHLRNEQRNFNINNIVEISKEAFVSFEQAEPPVTVQTQIQAVASRPVPRPNPSQRPNTNKSIFTKVTDANQWTNLLRYYRECLNHEYQQQFSISKNALFTIALDEEIVYSFLSGNHNLELRPVLQDRLSKFLDTSRRHNQQLCLGKSFVCLNPEKISPLLFVPVTFEHGSNGVVLLKPEECSLSYAALMNLGFDADEIANFLEEYQNFITNQPSIEDTEKFIIQALSDRLSRPLQVFSPTDFSIATIPNYAIYDGAGLFWANSEFTGNLITELSDLAESQNWNNAPDITHYLLDSLPEHEHAAAPEFIEDQRFYVTNINTQQRKAARAVADHPVTIVTGPPGTGKSQLVLNLIAQAYLDGKKVLFASHNNKAVDVVMNRLQGEIRFQGAIRTGSRPNRKKAVDQMESAIGQVHQPSITDFEVKYQCGKRTLKEASDQLDLIRDLRGKILSYKNERQEILDRLSEDQKERFSNINLPFVEEDKAILNEFLSISLCQFRALIDQRKNLIAEVREIMLNQDKKEPVVQLIREYESQWGRFAGGILHPEELPSLEALLSYCKTWKEILLCLSSKKSFNLAQRNLVSVQKRINQITEVMTEEQSTAALFLVEDCSEADFEKEKCNLDELKTSFADYQTNRYGFIKRIAISLGFLHPKEKIAEAVIRQMTSLGMKTDQPKKQSVTAVELQKAIKDLETVIETGGLLLQMQSQQQLVSKAKDGFDSLSKNYPPESLAEFEKLDLNAFESTSLIGFFSGIEHRVKESVEILQKEIAKCDQFIIRNNEQISSIGSFQKLDQQDETWDAFGMTLKLSENQASDWVQLWQRIIVLWEANAIILHSQNQLARLPSEEDALVLYQTASQSLFTLSGDLMRATWFTRASSVSNVTLQGTREYISAVKQLNDLDYGRDPNLYRALKEAERDNFIYALEMFPIWAITNLTARTNFPLDPEMFDLVIIDEASQCDIPSAIPLLYRSKKAVIIGDPNQLRHVATLATSLDKQIGVKYGIGLEVLSYVSHSLYDLGERSVGFHPGAIMLDEHYRSDPRIITFSNEEFYGGQLKTKTDLTRLGFQKDYLNQRGGAIWLNVKGEYQRPPNGSAINTAELQTIQMIVPQILNSLDLEGYKNASIGIVTPFRAQETKIHEWISQTYPGNSRIKSGTAHQFQGDECDIIVFSPVLTTGIQEGTLNWLEETYNLLNVAITRARVSLLVVGDFNFCYHDLQASSRYHRLAKYIKERLNGTFSSMDDLPLLGGDHFEILGTLLDPSNPEFNRTNLIRFIGSCKDFVDWIDPYFDQGIVDLFEVLFTKVPRPEIKRIRLITAERQVHYFDGEPAKLKPESVVQLRRQLITWGIEFEMRVIHGRELPHDRFLYHPGGAINMPPFAGSYGKHRHVSEYTPSKTTVEDFNQYWDKGNSIEKYLA